MYKFGEMFDVKKHRGVQEGRSPSFFFFPLSFEGEGDKGGEVDTLLQQGRLRRLFFSAGQTKVLIG